MTGDFSWTSDILNDNFLCFKDLWNPGQFAYGLPIRIYRFSSLGFDAAPLHLCFRHSSENGVISDSYFNSSSHSRLHGSQHEPLFLCSLSQSVCLSACLYLSLAFSLCLYVSVSPSFSALLPFCV